MGTDKKRLPRVYVIRHGQTEWSISGQHTGLTDIPLTQHGEDVVRELGPKVVGPGKLLDPEHIQVAFVSPRQRARKTFELLFEGCDKEPKSITDDDAREWDYGDVEGVTAPDFRKSKPELKNWDIWVDGCPNGETAEEMTARVDRLIQKIVKVTQAHHEKEEEDNCAGDVIVVCHGHMSRCLIARWCELPLTDGRRFAADPGAITVLGYTHHTFAERAMLAMNLYGAVEQ